MIPSNSCLTDRVVKSPTESFIEILNEFHADFHGDAPTETHTELYSDLCSELCTETITELYTDFPISILNLGGYHVYYIFNGGTNIP